VLWGGREGTETDACRRPDEAVKRLRHAIDYLCEYSIDKKYGFRFALEAKPNEPRGDIYMATTGAYLGLIPTLAHPEMVGVNPEVAHETMAGLNFLHAVAQAWEAGKLFHIDLNDQVPGRYDQDFRFGAANIKAEAADRTQTGSGFVWAGKGVSLHNLHLSRYHKQKCSNCHDPHASTGSTGIARGHLLRNLEVTSYADGYPGFDACGTNCHHVRCASCHPAPPDWARPQ
jgi:hypothetical protein